MASNVKFICLINLQHLHIFTPLFIHSFAMFCYVFLCELPWAVGSYSIGPPSRGIQQNIKNELMNNGVV